MSDQSISGKKIIRQEAAAENAVNGNGGNGAPVVLLPSLLDKYEPVIQSILSDLDQSASKHMPQVIANGLQRIFDAGLVFLAEDGAVHCESRATQFNSAITSDAILAEALNANIDIAATAAPFLLEIHPDGKQAESPKCVVVPLAERSDIAMFIYSFSEGNAFLEDVLGMILREIYQQTECFRQFVPAYLVKCAIYDRIKQQYHHVSDKMYLERYAHFTHALKRIEMHFEPIVRISKYAHSINIKSWEALARDKDTQRAPVNLFHAAEIWGVRFQTELDLYCLRAALETYMPQTRRSHEVQPLAVNVYPDTIMREVYRKELEKLMEDKLLSDDEKLVLEISEKTLIPENAPNEHNDEFADFRQVMVSLSQAFGIQFAIDDFGVGYASMSRMNRLRPSYIKIDRDILHFEHDLGKDVIRYLMSLKHKHIVTGLKIVMEGVDNESKISLYELVHELGVGYAQGHVFGAASPIVDPRLTPEKKQEIVERINNRNL